MKPKKTKNKKPIKGNTHEKLKVLTVLLIQKAAVGRRRGNEGLLSQGQQCLCSQDEQLQDSRDMCIKQQWENSRGCQRWQGPHSLRLTVNHAGSLTLSNCKTLHFTILGTEGGSLSDDLGFLHCSNYDTMKTNASRRLGKHWEGPGVAEKFRSQLHWLLPVLLPTTKPENDYRGSKGNKMIVKEEIKSTTWWSHLLETKGRKPYFISSHGLTHIWRPPPAGHLPLHQLRVPALLPSYERVFKGSAHSSGWLGPASL